MFRNRWGKLIVSLFGPTMTTIRKRSVAGRSGRLRIERLEDRLTPAVTTTFHNGLLSVLLDAAHDTASIAVVGSDVEVRDRHNDLISTTATKTVTDISATGNSSANQTVEFNADFIFAGLSSLAVD